MPDFKDFNQSIPVTSEIHDLMGDSSSATGSLHTLHTLLTHMVEFQEDIPSEDGESVTRRRNMVQRITLLDELLKRSIEATTQRHNDFSRLRDRIADLQDCVLETTRLQKEHMDYIHKDTLTQMGAMFDSAVNIQRADSASSIFWAKVAAGSSALAAVVSLIALFQTTRSPGPEPSYTQYNPYFPQQGYEPPNLDALHTDVKEIKTGVEQIRQHQTATPPTPVQPQLIYTSHPGHHAPPAMNGSGDVDLM